MTCRLYLALNLLGHMANKVQEAVKDTRKAEDCLYRREKRKEMRYRREWRP